MSEHVKTKEKKEELLRKLGAPRVARVWLACGLRAARLGPASRSLPITVCFTFFLSTQKVQVIILASGALLVLFTTMPSL